MDGWDYDEDIDLTAFSSGILEDPQAPYGGEKKESRVEFIRKLKKCTKVSGTEVVNLMERAASSPALNVIRYQLIKSATSSASNYRAACRARSQNEFYAKISIVVEETDETLFWLEMLFESEIKIDKEAVTVLGKEWQEILMIMATARKNSRRT